MPLYIATEQRWQHGSPFTSPSPCFSLDPRRPCISRLCDFDFVPSKGNARGSKSGPSLFLNHSSMSDAHSVRTMSTMSCLTYESIPKKKGTWHFFRYSHSHSHSHSNSNSHCPTRKMVKSSSMGEETSPRPTANRSHWHLRRVTLAN